MVTNEHHDLLNMLDWKSSTMCSSNILQSKSIQILASTHLSQFILGFLLESQMHISSTSNTMIWMQHHILISPQNYMQLESWHILVHVFYFPFDMELQLTLRSESLSCVTTQLNNDICNIDCFDFWLIFANGVVGDKMKSKEKVNFQWVYVDHSVQILFFQDVKYLKGYRYVISKINILFQHLKKIGETFFLYLVILVIIYQIVYILIDYLGLISLLYLDHISLYLNNLH